MTRSRRLSMQAGASLIEVLVSVVIVILGLLGLAGLHAKLQASEFEAYQRSQALLLLNDMSSRLELNRSSAAAYAAGAPVTAPLGAGMNCSTSSATLTERDLSQWCATLQGGAETTGATASRVGAMVGGRGCIETVQANREYRITVVWQGFTAVSPPPVSVACGLNSYDTADANAVCIEDRCRRYVSTLVRFGDLSSVPTP